MKLQELDQTELQAINGGADQSSSAGIGATISTDALLSLNFNWSNGNDQSYQSSLVVGKDIHTGVGAAGNGL